MAHVESTTRKQVSMLSVCVKKTQKQDADDVTSRAFSVLENPSSTSQCLMRKMSYSGSCVFQASDAEQRSSNFNRKNPRLSQIRADPKIQAWR